MSQKTLDSKELARQVQQNVSEDLEGASSPAQKILALRALTAQTQGLHEAQVQQLRIWGRAACPVGAVVSQRVDVDNHRIFLHYVSTESLQDEVKDVLLIWIRELLGPEWTLMVSRTRPL